MTDREKKLAEIREALEKATPGPWNVEGTEIWYRGDSYAGEDPHVWIADVAREANIHLIANAPEWLRWQQGEIERLTKDRNAYDAWVQALQRDNQQLREELEQVKAERNALLNAMLQSQKDLYWGDPEEAINRAIQRHDAVLRTLPEYKQG